MSRQKLLETYLVEATQEAFNVLGITSTLSAGQFGVSFDEGINSTILFKGDIVGKINVFVLFKDAVKIVARMLDKSPDEEISENEVCDGIGEMVNMLIGGVKTRCYKSACKFDISVPSTRLSHVPREAVAENMNDIRQYFLCDGLPFQVSFFYRENQQQETAAAPEKPKLSAADLLSQLIQKNASGQK